MSGSLERLSKELGAAIGSLQSDLKGKGVPHRHHARSILIPLGQIMLEVGDEDDASTTWTGKIRAVVEPSEEFWLAAVHEELSLSGAEHIRAVDPRFLEHPNYDFGYTIGARARLEARLLACQALDLEVPEGLLDRIAEADARLAPFLEPKQ